MGATTSVPNGLECCRQQPPCDGDLTVKVVTYTKAANCFYQDRDVEFELQEWRPMKIAQQDEVATADKIDPWSRLPEAVPPDQGSSIFKILTAKQVAVVPADYLADMPEGDYEIAWTERMDGHMLAAAEPGTESSHEAPPKSQLQPRS
mmetsp:Transcript_1783/g.4008  ORF Transcript_1783/g.4008 Transcript_1783/m.4008 type:complete len:148 (-) Transcript_1783:216-659(-)|eukprot:CAMPEP_0206494930 /NCGR_PEP_ID=MMETSP0324_2-20121206/48092_1 /ASSEMBLY_ACC=CAM_ASM_000836 /TAXON_ID=2866 /ORGANISM="Crypthecodinium cohnii, Strain Seligo" /LENGTH=147 /DNA_ID=CAMNT_0053978821 /DNA_START=251 /DNA_END=694 /DNA_ORIENTATION=+